MAGSSVSLPVTLFVILEIALCGGAGSNGGLGSCDGFPSVSFWGESVDSGTSKACGLSSAAGRLASSNSSLGAEGFLAASSFSSSKCSSSLSEVTFVVAAVVLSCCISSESSAWHTGTQAGVSLCIALVASSPVQAFPSVSCSIISRRPFLMSSSRPCRAVIFFSSTAEVCFSFSFFFFRHFHGLKILPSVASLLFLLTGGVLIPETK